MTQHLKCNYLIMSMSLFFLVIVNASTIAELLAAQKIIHDPDISNRTKADQTHGHPDIFDTNIGFIA